jgi:hypothetical protein
MDMYSEHLTVLDADDVLLLHDNANTIPGLTVKYRGLKKLPRMNNLVMLNISGSNITTIGPTPNLRDLYANNSELRKLSTSNVASLASLTCTNSNLDSLPEIMPELLTFNCTNTPLTKLPKMPKLIGLSCVQNRVQFLPDGLSRLQILFCDFTDLEMYKLEQKQKKVLSLMSARVTNRRSGNTRTNTPIGRLPESLFWQYRTMFLPQED